MPMPKLSAGLWLATWALERLLAGALVETERSSLTPQPFFLSVSMLSASSWKIDHALDTGENAKVGCPCL